MLAACGGSRTTTPTQDNCAGKGALPAPPVFFLDYPPSGSTNIPTNAGVLIEMGADNGQYPSATVTVSSGSAVVPLGAPTAVPSPLPTPFATPTGAQGPYVTVPMPTLSPNTAYTVVFKYMTFADNPPSCTVPASQTVGTFTTGLK